MTSLSYDDQVQLQHFCAVPFLGARGSGEMNDDAAADVVRILLGLVTRHDARGGGGEASLSNPCIKTPDAPFVLFDRAHTPLRTHQDCKR